MRQPLVHFLIVGALLGTVHAWWIDRRSEEPDRTIRVTAAEIDRLTAEWNARWNRPPTAEELDGLVRARVREAALYREAVAMGLDRNDPVIRRILVQKLEGIARNLVEMSVAPTRQDLETYLEQHAERYRRASLVTFTQVFVDPDRGGRRTSEEVERVLAELRSFGPPAAGVEGFGDPLMLEPHYRETTEADVAQIFGAEFARSIFELEPGGWRGPVRSGYGLHLVWVETVTEFPPPALDEIEDRVTEDWIDDRRTEITERYYAELLDRYDVIVERESGGPIGITR